MFSQRQPQLPPVLEIFRHISGFSHHAPGVHGFASRHRLCVAAWTMREEGTDERA